MEVGHYFYLEEIKSFGGVKNLYDSYKCTQSLQRLSRIDSNRSTEKVCDCYQLFGVSIKRERELRDKSNKQSFLYVII